MNRSLSLPPSLSPPLPLFLQRKPSGPPRSYCRVCEAPRRAEPRQDTDNDTPAEQRSACAVNTWFNVRMRRTTGDRVPAAVRSVQCHTGGLATVFDKQSDKHNLYVDNYNTAVELALSNLVLSYQTHLADTLRKNRTG
ncbi:hypothetical protein J6590_034638 [Homalodisca vitripennis]|nr:hypothetical protein J6590_034638 [Homalodisca vitripennis]